MMRPEDADAKLKLTINYGYCYNPVLRLGEHHVHLESPILNSVEVDEVKSFSDSEKGGFAHSTISTRYELYDGPGGMINNVEKMLVYDIHRCRITKSRKGSFTIVISKYKFPLSK